jgi:hypothetical protein
MDDAGFFYPAVLTSGTEFAAPLKEVSYEN